MTMTNREEAIQRELENMRYHMRELEDGYLTAGEAEKLVSKCQSRLTKRRNDAEDAKAGQAEAK